MNHEAISSKSTVIIDDNIVDTETGEILGHYETIPYEPKEVYKYNQRSPEECRSEEELYEVCRTLGEKASWNLFVNTDHLKELDKRTYIRMIKLIDCIAFRNIVFINRDSLEKCLSCGVTNINRTLDSLVSKGLIEYTTKGLLYRDTVRILINPSLAWKGNSLRRVIKVNNWYGIVNNDVDDAIHLDMTGNTKGDQVNIGDFEYEPLEIFESKYDPYVSGVSSNDKTEIDKILNMTDVRFSLFMNEERRGT